MRDPDEKGKSTKWFVGGGILIGATILILVLVVPWSVVFPPATTTPTAQATSSIIMTDWTSKEDLGELCPITVRGDKGKITNNEERYDITFYETVSTEVMPDDFSKDLSEYDYIMITVNPDEATDGYWTTYDYLFKNSGGNFDFTMYAYHEATDLYGLPLNVVGGTAWDLATDTNGTIALWYPTVTKLELHRGSHFDIEDDLDDLSQTTLDKLWNEKYYRSMPTLFTLTDDTTDHDKTGDYATITETFAIEFDFNTTISTVDGNAAQVNFTADCNVDFLVEFDADKIYFVTTESWNTLYENFEMFFEISTAVNITGATVKAGRVVIPNRFFGTSYTFTSLQTLATA